MSAPMRAIRGLPLMMFVACTPLVAPQPSDAGAADALVVDALVADAANDAGLTIARDCRTLRLSARGVTLLLEAGATPTRGQVHNAFALDLSGEGLGRVVVEIVASPGPEGDRLAFVRAGVGAEASLATCTRCLALRTQCGVGSESRSCTGPVYVLTEGTMAITVDGAAAGDGFQLEGEGLIARPASVDPETLETRIDASGGCIEFDRFVAAGTLAERACSSDVLVCAAVRAR